MGSVRLLVIGRVACLLIALSRLTGGLCQGALDRYPPTAWTVRAFVDNFDLSNNATFDQRVLSYSGWWRRGGPILLYLGNEGPVETFYNFTGAVFEHAEALGALAVFVEHRYYGQSQPGGFRLRGKQDMRGLTVEQAMADYAWFIPALKRRFRCGPAECPVITFGGSYGGMLVAWFRQKYPQLTVGGIAAGAPVDFYPGGQAQAAFWNATLHTFTSFGTPGCAEALGAFLASLQASVASPSGRSRVGERLGSCDPLEGEASAGAKADFFLRGIFASLAMLDYTEASGFMVPLPANPVQEACRRLQGGADALAGLRAVTDLYLNGTGNFRCYDLLAEMVGRPTHGKLKGPLVQPDMGPWQYQACNELILETLTSDGYGFYPAADEQLGEVAAACRLRFGVTPRASWLPLSLGGSDLRVGGLLFTDGEKDPWHTGAVKVDLVKAGVDIAHHLIPGAAHHEDLRFDPETPRPEVQKAKRLAREAMRRWLGESQGAAVLV